jgi:hypothetical protein
VHGTRSPAGGTPEQGAHWHPRVVIHFWIRPFSDASYRDHAYIASRYINRT